jgi:hypothetical protein
MHVENVKNRFHVKHNAGDWGKYLESVLIMLL